jgi:hypothetical protein
MTQHILWFAAGVAVGTVGAIVAILVMMIKRDEQNE